MRIFIEELQISLGIDADTFKSLQGWINVFDSILTPIHDHKSKLQLNADYLVETFADFATFYRFYSAGSVLLGGILLLSSNIFKLNHPEKEKFLDLEPDEILGLDEFKQYLATPDYKRIIDGVISIGNTRTKEDARQSIRATAKGIGELVFNNAVEKNVESIFRVPDVVIRGASALEIMKSREQFKCLNVWIESEQRAALIFFNGAQQEFALLDKWMATPELKLDIQDNHYQIADRASFIQWFNALRSKLDSECNYNTLMSYVDRFPKAQAEAYRTNIRNKITIIAAENSESIYQTRIRVVGYINRILNSRKGYTEKKFIELKEAELDAALEHEHKKYTLSLYQ